ncbi:hypothetical protein RUND412_003839 [Rhizina undulata]
MVVVGGALTGGNEHRGNVAAHIGNPDLGPCNGCGAHNPAGAWSSWFSVPQGHHFPLDAAHSRHANGQFVAHTPSQRPVNHQPNAVPAVEILDVPVTVFQAPYGWVVPLAPVVSVVQHRIHYHPIYVQSVAKKQIVVYYNGYSYQ